MTKSLCAVTCAFLLAGGTLSSVVSAGTYSAENLSSSSIMHLHLSQSGGGATDPRTGTGDPATSNGGMGYGNTGGAAGTGSTTQPPGGTGTEGGIQPRDRSDHGSPNEDMQHDRQRPGAEQRDVDNTGRNERDASGSTLTPGDQSNRDSDVELTRKIRSAVTDDNSLSTTAQNVKIITQNGKVTLRGPVTNEQERNKILSAAKKIAGPEKVEDQLEVSGRQAR